MDEKDMGHYIFYSDGRIFKKKTGKFLKCGCNGDGYPMAYVNGKQYKVHRLIANAFLPIIPGKNCINHKNGIKADNRVDNLEWCTQKENVRHAFKNGFMVRHKGSKNHQSKLKEDEVIEIKKLLKQGSKTLKSIGQQFKVTEQAIFMIKKGRNWGHIV